MDAWHQDARATIYHGDCLEVLRALPDASVDAVVTDPPYGLGFMGKAWDDPAAQGAATRPRADGDHTATPFKRARAEYGGASYGGNYAAEMAAFQAWCELWAAECLRVLKPGGHLLAFGGTRTWHRLACAIEDAGFEVRDSIAWMYGSGFPKSLDVSKAIDKRREEDRAPRVAVTSWVADQCDKLGWTRARLCAEFGVKNQPVQSWTERNPDYAVIPTWDNWLRLKAVVGFDDSMDAEVWRLNGRKGTPGEAWDQREVTGQHAAGNPIGVYEHKLGAGTGRSAKERRDVAVTDAAREWSGWGTALKPAHEPIVVARKPLVGTVAANVLEHGTGALNIDGCRIAYANKADRPTQEQWNRKGSSGAAGANGFAGQFSQGMKDAYAEGKIPMPPGRWPANVVLDEDQAAELDRQSGVSTSTPFAAGTRRSGGILGNTTGRREPMGHNDSGGASRFFYVAKAPARERPKVDGTAHPTVKPLTLMRWLCRLVTPPNGVILEPFAGSGTTVEAALLEGFRVVAIEREADYLPLIQARLDRVAAQEPEDEQLTLDASA
jgi:DNA modification methylase